jgi:hypothetical protein
VLVPTTWKLRGRWGLHREVTGLQKKLEVLAGDIGKFGLGAAVVALSAMSVEFSYSTFVVDHQPWSWSFLTDYLHFLIQSITILVRFAIVARCAKARLAALTLRGVVCDRGRNGELYPGLMVAAPVQWI